MALYQHPDLDPMAAKIIEMCLAGASADAFARLTDNAALPPRLTMSGNPS